jgi:hypothetical protein
MKKESRDDEKNAKIDLYKLKRQYIFVRTHHLCYKEPMFQPIQITHENFCSVEANCLGDWTAQAIDKMYLYRPQARSLNGMIYLLRRNELARFVFTLTQSREIKESSIKQSKEPLFHLSNWLCRIKCQLKHLCYRKDRLW